MTRTAISLAAASIAVLILSGPAAAGQYEVHGCRAPGGAPLPAVGWLGTYGPGHWFSSDDTCARGGHPQAALLRVATYEHLQGARSEWRFRAPAGTAIRRVRGAAAMHTAHDRPYSSPVVLAQADDGQGRFGIGPGSARGSLHTPEAAANAFDTGVMAPTAAYSFVAACSGGGGRCPEGGAADPAVALVRLFRANVTLEDLSAPMLAAPLGGALAEPGVHRGVEGIGVAASDAGSGVRRLVLELDGAERAAVTLDANSGQCEDLVPGTGARDYAVPVPCPHEVSGGVSLDTRGLPEGDHELRLFVEDAAGNRRLAAGPVSPWIVDNEPSPSPPPPVLTPPPSVPAPVGPVVAAAVPPRARLELWFVTLARRQVCERRLAGTGTERACVRRPVGFAERRGAALTQRYGRELALTGRVELADGSPVSGARILVQRRPSGAAAVSERGVARSDSRGRFSFRLGRAGGERIAVSWQPAGALAPVRSRTLTRRVRAGLSLAVGAGGTRLRGTLHGGRRPRSGVPVLAEAWTRRGWAVIARTRVRPGRRAFDLPAALPPGRWRVRLRALATPGWPYEEGTSPTRAIYVRP